MESKNMSSINFIEKTITSKEIYQGKSFSFYSDVVETSKKVRTNRDYVKYPEAVVIAPFIDDFTILLIRQYRYPVKEILYELPAGKLDYPEESKLDAAKRELLEETGYKAENFEFLFSYYPCAAYSTEKLYLYMAMGLTKSNAKPDEDEIIEPYPVKLNDAISMIKRGAIVDAKTIIALLYLNSYL